MVGRFQQSAITRFLTWTDTLPGHGWWVFAAIFAAQIAWGQAVLWQAGRLPVGAIEVNLTTLAVYGPFALGGVAFGNWLVKRAVAAFWPATGLPADDRGAWIVEFIQMPSRLAVLALVIGAVGGVAALLVAPASVLGPEAGRMSVYLAYGPAFVLGYGAAAFGFVQTLRWLRRVARLHREATAIDPLDRAPVYAFSGLTAPVGLAYVLTAYFSLTVNAAFQAGNLVSLGFIGAGTLTGIAAFIAPLWGIHDRLTREKEVRLRDVERHLGRLERELYARVEAGAFETTKVIIDTYAGVDALRERVARLPTWPWPPELLRGFVSALLLPIVVFLLTRVISDLI